MASSKLPTHHDIPDWNTHLPSSDISGPTSGSGSRSSSNDAAKQSSDLPSTEKQPEADRITLPSFRDLLPAHIVENTVEPAEGPPQTPDVLEQYQLPHRTRDGRVITMPYTMQKPENEAIHSATRKTVNGKTLTYTLTVKQQPERARACGAGARACADRRPVDPPPVVELRVFEGDSTKTDITLSYNASFFLFATLEIARPIANGRIHTTQTIPVLTGCPVAGANYLDRPAPAAYFLFPDLSVRHEGWYRLSFALYEATKEAEDLDVNHPARNPEVETPAMNQPKALESMDWRLEVKSTPFQVYSAKKFPGLSESTEISRIVADQGCRVRIRRDIRMRKRTNKDDYEGYEEGMPYGDRHPTPDSAYPPHTPTEGHRSASRCSMDGSQFGNESYRRYSHSDAGHHANSYSARLPSLTAPSSSSQLTGLPALNLSRPGSSREFAVPFPPTRALDRPQLPVPAAMPQTIVPDPAHSAPLQGLQLPALLTETPSRQPGAQYDPARRHWNLPEPTSSAKRSHSPRADITEMPLKGGMRPDLARTVSGYTTGSIEADTDPYGNVEDEPQFMQQFMEYRRACGRSNRKRMPNLAS